MPVATLTEFHHWLLADDTTGAPFIVLEKAEGSPLGCAATVARHLNEFDDESVGNWITLTQEVVLAIAADPAQRRLLGVPEGCGNCAPTSSCGLRKVLAALARRGHIIFDHPLAFEALAELEPGFRASIGTPAGSPEEFHIILNPARFHARCLAPLIADSFLEWTASRQRSAA